MAQTAEQQDATERAIATEPSPEIHTTAPPSGTRTTSPLSKPEAPKRFSKSNLKPFVKLALGFPYLWPETETSPLTLKLEYLMTEDADREQSAFIAMTDEEQKEASYEYDCRLLSLLVCRVPEGFEGFPAIVADTEGRPANPSELRIAVFNYFFVDDDEDVATAMRFVARRFMARYWQAIMPSDYL